MTCASMFMAWVLFAELVIDRYGWHEFLSFYRFADVCPYEFVVLGLIGVFGGGRIDQTSTFTTRSFPRRRETKQARLAQAIAGAPIDLLKIKTP